MRRLALKMTIMSILLCMSLGLFGSARTSASVTGDLKIHYIDVDCSADAIFVELPNGKKMLIDGGHTDDVVRVKSYLTSIGFSTGSTIDYVFGTHSHADHIGGMEDIINSYNVGVYYQPKELVEASTTTEVKNALAAKGKSITHPVLNSNIFNVDNELILTVLGPARTNPVSSNPGSYYKDINDFSLVMKLTYKNKSILFTGDQSLTSETEMTNAYSASVLKSDVLKVGHHGSNTSTSAALVSEVDPEFAVFPSDVARNDGSARAPSKAALDLLYGNDTKVFRVGEQGTIVMTTNGTTLSFNKSDVPLNSTYSYGSQLDENKALGTEDSVFPSTDYTRIFNATFESANPLSAWTIEEGMFEGTKLIDGSKEGGSVTLYTNSSTSHYAKIDRNGTEYVDASGDSAKIQMKLSHDKPFIGNVRVVASLNISAMADNPNALAGEMVIMQKDGTRLVYASFDSTHMYLRNLGNSDYEGTKVVDFTPGTWFTVKFDVNTRKGTFRTYYNNTLIDFGNSAESFVNYDLNVLDVMDDANFYGIAFSATDGKIHMYVDDVRVYLENYLFEDDFDDQNFAGWTNSGADFATLYTFLGSAAAARLTDSDSITKSQSTANKTNTIAVDYAWRASPNMAADDLIIAEWYDGSAWHQISTIDMTVDEYKFETHYLPAGASNNANFKLRFRANGIGTYAGFIDNVDIRDVAD
ncbi:MBL fold metallo-hydrolase [Paenibacillus qinlingensis]|uniref:Beta-lactamase superfamily II metal-dependent hydrolase n=1 Tax=Paenibacillus qinlingensis TaxID=1837343 RepID=A0ABU1P117_9BACL|nr:MBL fold metallo-hydrolase [Paenibacillus qinlingensis]MDR6553441.1 beta-lactamase superfamily II metal-dependent hydrolase [Paenibacillus qinlingensis]